jgi:nucleoside-diphosphate-sugar epimerase
MHTKTPAAAARARDGRVRLGKPRLLIVGCGDIGLRIVARLNRRFRIFATTASPDRCAALRAAGAVPIVLDLDRACAKTIAGLAPRLLYLAPPPEAPTDARVARLLRILRRAPDRFVYVSTTGVYGDRRGELVDETARLAPVTERARRRVDAEQRTRTHPWHASVLRVPGIYGPGRLPIERLKRAVPAPLPAQDVLTNHIHADDLARICVAALFRSAPRRVYNANDDSRLHLGEYLDLVAQQFGLPRAPRLAHAQLRQAVSPMQFSFFEESRRLSNRRLKNELGVRLQFPTVSDGLTAAARAQSESG